MIHNAKANLDSNHPNHTKKTMNAQLNQSSHIPGMTLTDKSPNPFYRLHFDAELIEKVCAEGNNSAADWIRISNSWRDDETLDPWLHDNHIKMFYIFIWAERDNADDLNQPITKAALNAVLQEMRSWFEKSDKRTTNSKS